MSQNCHQMRSTEKLHKSEAGLCVFVLLDYRILIESFTCKSANYINYRSDAAMIHELQHVAKAGKGQVF